MLCFECLPLESVFSEWHLGKQLRGVIVKETDCDTQKVTAQANNRHTA